MTETKRVPTELEAKALLRRVADKMKDDEIIGRYASASASARLPLGRMVPFMVALLAGMVLLSFLEGSVPTAVWIVMAGLFAMVVDQAVEILRLTRVTAALARAAERAQREEPLPHAPSLEV